MTDQTLNPTPDPNPSSPAWNNTTKAIVAVLLITIAAAFLVKFKYLVGPLLMAVIFSYLIHPVVERFQRKLRGSWKLSVNLIFLVIILIVIGLLTWGGITLIEQVQNLINFLQQAVQDLPNFIETTASTPIVIGPYTFNWPDLDVSSLTDQILSWVSPVLSQLGSVVGTIASGAAEIVGWSFFTIVIAYFILSETAGERAKVLNIQIPGYREDQQRMGRYLSNIWNAFLRGQVIIFLAVVLIYTIFLGSVGISFFFGLALLAGLARFVPYVGAWITWITYGLVAYFQGTTIFGLTPFGYVILVVAMALVIDMMIDNMLVPKLMGAALRLHPALVMVSALVGLNLFGLMGMILSAPTVATAKLIMDYAIRKMTDQDPWEGVQEGMVQQNMPAWLARLGRFLNRIRKSVVNWIKDLFTKARPSK
ncbi:MAG TPA: AI-2E family transporter [Longilinea sp.]|nr:AI-2E family transporter [Longilinea sp.]